MNSHKSPTIGIAVLTYRSSMHLQFCLPPLLESQLNPKVLVVDSSSDDGTVELARRLGADTFVIPKSEFNHGRTREMARKFLNTDIVIMVTQDAYAIDSDVISRLVAPIVSGQASVAYARQLPHDGADFFEAFAREFNYPPESHVRSLKELDKYGIYTYFCSNSCAAYLNSALDEIGGFQEVLTGEDTVAVAKLLEKGHRIAYVADACVKHSHKYSLLQEFRRHFDTGFARRDYQNLLREGGKDEKRGKEYVQKLMKRLINEKPLLIPYGFLHVLAKLTGYRIGRMSKNAPVWFKKALSSHPFYWNSR